MGYTMTNYVCEACKVRQAASTAPICDCGKPMIPDPLSTVGAARTQALMLGKTK